MFKIILGTQSSSYQHENNFEKNPIFLVNAHIYTNYSNQWYKAIFVECICLKLVKFIIFKLKKYWIFKEGEKNYY